MNKKIKKYDKNKPYEEHAREYTKRYLSHTADYKKNKDNDYYHIEKFTDYLWRKYGDKVIKNIRKKS